MLASKELRNQSTQPSSKTSHSPEKKGRPAAAPFIQTKLKIGSPGDSFEREADSMADYVMSGLNSKKSSSQPASGTVAPGIQKMDNEEEQVMTKADAAISSSAPQNLHARLSSSKGQGSALQTDIRTKMESGFNANFSNVRIHTGPSAIQMSRDIGARAFTYGSDIYFNQSEYNPGSKRGQHLLAHELTHTIQQGAVSSSQSRAGSQSESLQRKPNGKAPKMIQMVPTAYGDFDTIKYNDITTISSGHEVGVQMHLKFTPNSKVDSTSIGLTQIATGTHNGSLINSGIYGRRSATSGAGVGHFIDHLGGFPNPVYASEANPRAGASQQDLDGYDTKPITQMNAAQKALRESRTGVTGVDMQGFGKNGHRYTSGGQVVGPVDAELFDAPMLPGSGNSSEQVFETAAIALNGVQKGQYYGSVEWGWRRNATGTFTRLPLRVISEGVPSNNFMTAAVIWNNATENIGTATSQVIANAQTLRISGGRATPVQGVTVNVPANTTLNILAQVSSGSTNYYIASATINSATQTVLVPVSQTRQIDVGRPTVDLPIVDVFTITSVAGGMLNQGITGATQTHLRDGTRVRKVGLTYGPFQAGDPRINMVEVEVVQGPHTGKIGYLDPAILTQEVRGTR